MTLHLDPISLTSLILLSILLVYNVYINERPHAPIQVQVVTDPFEPFHELGTHP